jgi:hypothetical protein
MLTQDCTGELRAAWLPYPVGQEQDVKRVYFVAQLWNTHRSGARLCHRGERLRTGD